MSRPRRNRIKQAMDKRHPIRRSTKMKDSRTKRSKQREKKLLDEEESDGYGA